MGGLCRAGGGRSDWRQPADGTAVLRLAVGAGDDRGDGEPAGVHVYLAPHLFLARDTDRAAGRSWHPRHGGSGGTVASDAGAGDRDASVHAAQPTRARDAGLFTEPSPCARGRDRRGKGGARDLDHRGGAGLCGLIIGLSEAAAVQFVGAEWRAAVAFVILMAVLLVRPMGLFGVAER